MHQIISQAQEKFGKALQHLAGELRGVRSGRATSALVEHIKVEAYGTITPLLELASIASPEPRLLIVSPWDPSIMKEVEKALQGGNLGVNPTVDGKVIRLNFPPLSEERRKELVKVLGTKLEEARVSIRGVREEVQKILKQEKSDGGISEDEFFTLQKELQKLVDEQNDKIKQIGAEKEQEVMTI